MSSMSACRPAAIARIGSPLRSTPSTTRTYAITPLYWSNSESKISARGGASGSPAGGGTRATSSSSTSGTPWPVLPRCAGSPSGGSPISSATSPATRSGSAPGRSSLFRHGISSRPASTARYVLATVCASTPWAASTTSSAPSHAASERETSYVKSTWPGRVDQVQLVGLPVGALEEHAHRLRLDRDAPLALEVHRVEHLRAHVALVHGVRQLEDAVGERRLAVVDVRDDREVADVGLVHGS